MEPEEWGQVEEEVVDTLREERLERVRRRQLEWAANMICKEMAREVIKKTMKESDRRVCRDIVEITVVDECWKHLEYGRIMRQILTGDNSLKLDIDRGLREVKEAGEAMLTEEATATRWQEKVISLKRLDYKDEVTGV